MYILHTDCKNVKYVNRTMIDIYRICAKGVDFRVHLINA